MSEVKPLKIFMLSIVIQSIFRHICLHLNFNKLLIRVGTLTIVANRRISLFSYLLGFALYDLVHTQDLCTLDK